MSEALRVPVRPETFELRLGESSVISEAVMRKAIGENPEALGVLELALGFHNVGIARATPTPGETSVSVAAPGAGGLASITATPIFPTSCR